METDVELKPWAYGPFELIGHAEEHLKSGSDFDKRIALIGYDNAIEVSITTFLNLHPKQRHGKTYPREKVDQWLANYHSKLDFLENYLKNDNESTDISIDEIIYIHNLRNELYHSGTGMVPEERSLSKARTTAKLVFSIFFNCEADSLIYKYAYRPHDYTSIRKKYSEETQFLQSFIELGNILKSILEKSYKLDHENLTRKNLIELFKLLGEHCKSLPKKYEDAVVQAQNIRNKIVHGEYTNISEKDLSDLSLKINQICSYLSTYIYSVDILPTLYERYTQWIRSDIKSVRLVNKSRKIFLEITSKLGSLDDEIIALTDLSFIGRGYDDDSELFSSDKSAQENTDEFLKLDPYSLYMCTELFTREGGIEVSKKFGPK